MTASSPLRLGQLTLCTGAFVFLAFGCDQQLNDDALLGGQSANTTERGGGRAHATDPASSGALSAKGPSPLGQAVVTVCRQSDMTSCDDGCGPGYTQVSLSSDCCACKPSTCDTTACAPPLCAPGETLALPPESCCPTCVPEVTSCDDEEAFVCTTFTCGEGYIPHETEDGCCTTCAADDMYCADERGGFSAYRRELLTAEATACEDVNDCAILDGETACASEAFAGAVNVHYAAQIDAALIAYAEDHCSHCPPYVAYCGVRPELSCWDGTCQL